MKRGLGAAVVALVVVVVALCLRERANPEAVAPSAPSMSEAASSALVAAPKEGAIESEAPIVAERTPEMSADDGTVGAEQGVLLTNGQRIAIRVTAPSGSPVRRAVVRLYSKTLVPPRDLSDLQPAVFRASSKAVEITDEHGEAVWLRGVVADTFVLVEAPGFAPCSGTVTADDVAAGISSFPLENADSIVARVVDGVTSLPLAGVTAIACPHVSAERMESGTPELTIAALAAQRETTGVDGRVAIRELAQNPGSALWLFANGYPTRCVYPINTQPIEQVIRLYGGTRVSGRVVDESGAPLPGVLVAAAIAGVNPSQEVCRGTTIEDGSFALDNVPPTALVWVVRKLGYGVVHRYAFEPQEARPLEFVLPLQVACSGVVVDDAGHPIPAARLEFISMQSTGLIGNYETHDDGSFDMPWVERDSTLMIRASATGYRSREFAGVPPTKGMRIVLPRDGSLRGRVRDASGAPVTEFRIGWRATTIDLENESNSAESMPWRDCSSPDGHFDIAGVTAEVVEVYVDAPGCSRPPPRLVAVPPGGASDLAEFELTAARTISGRVVDSSGLPILGATVSWLLESFAGEPLGRQTPTTCNTDNDGQFSLRGMPDLPFTLRVTDNVHPNAFYPDLAASEFPREIVYGASSFIEGRIAMSWTAPECAVTMTARHEGTQTFSWLTVDSTGRFRWGPIPSGRWTLELYDRWTERSSSSWYVRQIETVDVAPGETKRVDFDVQWPGRVLGRVRSALDGDLSQRLEARLFAVDEAGRATKLTHIGCVLADGTFGLCSIPLGRYRLQIVSLIRGYGAIAEQLVELTPAAPTARVTLELAKATLSGRVVDGDSHPLVADVRVVRESDRSLAYTTRSDRDGSYRLAPLEDEAFRLVVSAPGFADDRTDPIDPDEVDRAPLEHMLEPEARLIVRVRDDAGVPLDSIDVELIDAAAATTTAPGSATRWTGRTAIDGTTTATRLPAGSFLLRCRHAAWPGITPAPIDLEWGETRTHELTLTRFGRATVQVVGAAGVPLPEVVVTIMRDGDPASERTITTDAAGTLAADRLTAGRWLANCDRADLVAFVVVPGVATSVTLVQHR